jgi:site-specific DNA recombinase
VTGIDDRDKYVVPDRQRSGRRYLLTGGTAVCGVCHAPLSAQIKAVPAGGSRAYYMCHRSRGGRGCVSIPVDPLEEYVIDQLLSELENPVFLAVYMADDHSVRRGEISNTLLAIDAQRVDLAEMWSSNELTAAEWQAARRGLAAQEQVARTELMSLPQAGAGVDPVSIRADWAEMNLDERRTIITKYVASVTLAKARLGLRQVDVPGRASISWRMV